MGEARHDGNRFGRISALPRKVHAGPSFLALKITSDKALYRSQIRRPICVGARPNYQIRSSPRIRTPGGARDMADASDPIEIDMHWYPARGL